MIIIQAIKFFLLAGSISLLGLITVACGAQTAPTSQPASPSVDKTEVRNLIEEAIKSAVAEAAVDARVSQEELNLLVAEALAESSNELVASSIAKAMDQRPQSITTADVRELIQAEIAETLGDTSLPLTDETKPTIVFSDLRWESARLQNRIAMFIVEHGSRGAASLR